MATYYNISKTGGGANYNVNNITSHVLFFDARQRRFVDHAVFAAAYQPGVTVHARDEPVRVSGQSESRVRFEFGRDGVRVNLVRAVESNYVCENETFCYETDTAGGIMS